MLGLIYILVCFFTGYAICTITFPRLSQLTLAAFDGNSIKINPYFLVLPVWYLTGTLCVTWATYFVAYLWRVSETPLKYANLIVTPLFLLLSMIVYWKNKEKNKKNSHCKLINLDKKVILREVFFLIIVTIFVSILMWVTFFIKDNKMYVGVTVFGDFAPHLGMIRSFSFGNNYPTQYSHFAGEDIRYHFMFQFLVGNLEYLGMRVDFAFNIPSILSLIATFMLLYVLTVKLTKRTLAGYLACLFFAFRSSGSLFTFLSKIPKGMSIWKALKDNVDYIGYTPNENWGLWNLNVYCNQRHLAFSLAVMIVVIILFLPHLFAMFRFQKQIYKETKTAWVTIYGENKKNIKYWSASLFRCLYILFFTREGWIVREWKLAITSGILLGSIAFWNGAALIATLTILFVMAIFSERRLEFLIMALLSTILSVLQSRFFIYGTPVSPQYYFGFIAENKTLFGVAAYIKTLLGILPIILFAAFLVETGIKKYLMLAFSAPLFLAFTLSLTTDVTVNHKYIVIGVMLLGIFAADLLSYLFQNKDVWTKFGCIIIVVLLTGTGFYDFTCLLRKNHPSTAIVLNTEDELTKWIKNNSNSKDLYLTSNYSLHRVVLGGAMLYQGWQYYAWSAGYDTVFRDTQVKLMYEADTPEELKELVKINNIRYIIVDSDNRYNIAYELNENNIKNTFASVYEDGDGDWLTSVYDTSKVK